MSMDAGRVSGLTPQAQLDLLFQVTQDMQTNRVRIKLTPLLSNDLALIWARRAVHRRFVQAL